MSFDEFLSHFGSVSHLVFEALSNSVSCVHVHVWPFAGHAALCVSMQYSLQPCASVRTMWLLVEPFIFLMNATLYLVRVSRRSRRNSVCFV